MWTLSQADRTKRLALDALFAALAMILSYIESLLPLQMLIPLPGVKLGLANLAVVLVFSLVGQGDAALISAVRILAMGLLFGSPTSLYFSATGGLLSFLTLLLLQKTCPRCSFLGVSVLCAAAHNVGQILAASTLFGFELMRSYLPLLLFSAILCGAAVGGLLNLLVPRLEKIMQKNSVKNNADGREDKK